MLVSQCGAQDHLSFLSCERLALSFSHLARDANSYVLKGIGFNQFLAHTPRKHGFERRSPNGCDGVRGALSVDQAVSIHSFAASTVMIEASEKRVSAVLNTVVQRATVLGEG